MTQKLDIHTESYAIPFTKVVEALDYMTYGSEVRVMFLMMGLTGCRLTTLNNFVISKFFDRVVYFKEAKTGKFRKEELPQWYLEELSDYRKNHKVFGEKVFGITAETLRRYFNRDIRPKLGEEWNTKRPHINEGSGRHEYIYQLKGLRKNYQTLKFSEQIDKWGDPYVALQFTAKKMKHSSDRITAYHYLENFDTLEIKKFAGMDMGQIYRGEGQKTIMDYF